jgi:hypothetical protein
VLTLNSNDLKRFIRFSRTTDAGTGSSSMTVNGYGLKKYS